MNLKTQKKWALTIGSGVLLTVFFQNCGKQFETASTLTPSSQSVSEIPNTSSPEVPTSNSSTFTQNETTIQQAAQLPSDNHFSGVKWGGVFDPRVPGTSQFSPTPWSDAYAIGQGACVTAESIVTKADGTRQAEIYWNFVNNKMNAEESLTSLKISPGENLVFKVVIPPGTSAVTTNDQAGFWGSVWTQSTPRNTPPQNSHAQSYGAINSLVSYPEKNGFVVAPSFLITQPFQEESYGMLWFQHRGDDVQTIAVKEFGVYITIKDFNLYNQWLNRTTSTRCP